MTELYNGIDGIENDLTDFGVAQWIIDSYDSDEHFFDTANALLDLYVSYKGRYVISKADKTFIPKTGDDYVRLDNRAICAHLNHKFAVSIYAGKSCSKFLCFDVDDGSKQTVTKIIDELSFAGFDREKIYVSSSGRKGFHVEMFFDKLMYTGVLKVLYDYVCKEAGLNTHKVEFRPTYTQAIKLPLGVHSSTGDVCWYVDPVTFKPFKDPRYILKIQKFNCEYAYQFIRFLVGDDLFFKAPYTYHTPPKEHTDTLGIAQFEFSGSGKYGYPMLTAKHMTHHTIVQIARRERCKGLREEDIVDRLNEWLDEQDEQYLSDPIPRIRKDIADVAKWVYSESFHVSKNVKLIFTAEEIKLLIERRPRIQRQFIFTVLCYQKRYGMLRLGAEKIAEAIGCSRLAVVNAANTLEQEGIIEVTRQSALKIGDMYKPMPNIYRIIGKAKKPGDVWNLVDELELSEGGLQEMWKEFVHKTIRVDDWKKYFTAKEIKELKGEKENG